jgi:UDP-N-acetyl-D-glucosamine dehydrogenase
MTTTKQELCQKINQRKANITVIGLGYVGLPMCVEFAHKGFFVAGVDKDAEKIKQLKAGKSYIMDISPETLQSIQRNFSPTTNFHVLSEADVVIICVPTPLNKTKDPDLSYIAAATAEIKKNLQPNQLIILESTTYPGTTDEIVLPQLEETGLKVGRDFFLAFSPERIDPGNATWNFRNTPKIVGGVTTDCGELAELLYTDVVDRVVRVSSSKSAEMVKLLENTFRAINIAMVNEVAIMCNKLGIDTWEVIDAAATKPFGYMPFYPGPGLGGHCIPIDPQYLSWKLKMLNYSAKFIELADEINSSMPEYVVTKITDALNFESRSVKGSKIVLLGVAYKKNSNDLRESPALDIAKLLKLRGADVVYHDPYIPQMILDSETIHSEELTPSLLKHADCVVIVTDHEDYDWQFVVDHSKLILDTRNAVRKTRAGKSRIVKL